MSKYECEAQVPFMGGVIGYYVNYKRKLSSYKILIGRYQCQAEHTHVWGPGDEVLPIAFGRKWPPTNFVCPKDRGLLVHIED